MLKILIVEDTQDQREWLAGIIRTRSPAYSIVEAGDKETALRIFQDDPPDLAILDLMIPETPDSDRDDWRFGRDVLRQIRRSSPSTKTIVMTEKSELSHELLQDEGADDFFSKAYLSSIKEGPLRQEKFLRRITELIGHLACRSAAMQNVREKLSNLHEQDHLIVIEGKAGTGKRHLASVLHRCSQRARRRIQLVPISEMHVDAIADALRGIHPASRGTRFEKEEATIGTLVLSDMDRLPLLSVEKHFRASDQRIQAAICDALMAIRDPLVERGRLSPVNYADVPRVIITSSESLAQLGKRGVLSPQLHTELAHAKYISLPGLEERQEDIAELLSYYRWHANQRWNKSLINIHPWAQRVIEEFLSVGKREAGDLVAVVENAIKDAEPEASALLPRHLSLQLPEKYEFTYALGEGVKRTSGSFGDLAVFASNPSIEILMFASTAQERPFQGESLVDKVILGGFSHDPYNEESEREITIENPYHGRMLYVLANHAGEDKRVVEDLHIPEPKGLMFTLRKLLGDNMISRHESRFFISRYGGYYRFKENRPFCLVEEIPLDSPTKM